MTTETKVIIGFDFGLKRIGVAVGQTITRTARPLTVIAAKNGQPDIPSLNKVFKEWQPESCVVGIPLNMDGTEQPITHKAREFCRLLSELYQIPIHEMDERLSTVDARDQVFTKGGYKALKNTAIDSVAAQLILQTLLSQDRID